MLYAFADCTLDTNLYTLQRAGKGIHLRPKVFHMLLYLLQHREHVVSKYELTQEVWPEQFVSEATLEGCMKTVRQALGDSGRAQRLIQTLHGHGYRFIAPVVVSGPEQVRATESPAVGSTEEPADSVAEVSVAPAAPQEAVDGDGGTIRVCPECQYSHHVDGSSAARFCLACGAALVLHCPQCGVEALPHAKFCMACGAALRSNQQAPLAAHQPQMIEAHRAVRGAVLLPVTGRSEAERRQLTILSCDLEDAAVLAAHLGLEAFYALMRAYQDVCIHVIERFDGHISQYLGGGMLVAFGYPLAHEDDALRAVRTGLGMLEALTALNAQQQRQQTRPLPAPLRLRIGIHTGAVVMGETGGGAKREHLALGETPTVAAHLQHLAAPDTVVISAATYHLVQGYVLCEDLGRPTLTTPAPHVHSYRVLGESATRSRFDVAAARGLTPLVGRASEVALLLERWQQVQDGTGQIVLLSGEAGIGKSRLVEMLHAHVAREGVPRLVLQCSPYHTNSAFYPILVHIERLLGYERDDTPATKLQKLEHALQGYGFVLTETVPLLAALLFVPCAERYTPLHLSPERLKQQTYETLVAWLLAAAERQPLVVVWEDLHWADPSTLAVLTLALEQTPLARVLMLLTCRPEFQPPLLPRLALTHLALNHFGRAHTEEMIALVTDGKTLPDAVLRHIVEKTDGVPLFIEEMMKAIMALGLLEAVDDHYELTEPLSAMVIPATLQDALMARLDRLGTAKSVAQLGATLGRQFSAALLHAVSPLDATALQQELRQLVEAELLLQRGMGLHATYVFKHALIQDVAYQSLLRQTRQQYHRQIAQVLAAHFQDIAATQPELLAHHYTEAGMSELAIASWHQAGQRAVGRLANAEAGHHLSRGLMLLKTLPETPERLQQELDMLLVLGPAFIASKGYASPEVQGTYLRAQTLCEQVGDTPRLFSVLRGLWWFCVAHEEFHIALGLGEQLLALAEGMKDTAYHLEAHRALVSTLLFLGEFTRAQTHFVQGVALYNPQQHRAHALRYGSDPGVACLSFGGRVLWFLGYPDQALQRGHEALTLAKASAHSHTLAQAMGLLTNIYQMRREAQLTQEWAEHTIGYATEQGLPYWAALASIMRGWALAEQGQHATGLRQIHQGMEAYQATGATLGWSWFLTLLAEAYGHHGQPEEGIQVLDQALERVDKAHEWYYATEIYRVRGELLHGQGRRRRTEAGACFQQALTIARRQHAKSCELRVAVSLARLQERQGKRGTAQPLLASLYAWFTEGAATPDLQEAQRLLAVFAGR